MTVLGCQPALHEAALVALGHVPTSKGMARLKRGRSEVGVLAYLGCRRGT